MTNVHTVKVNVVLDPTGLHCVEKNSFPQKEGHTRLEELMTEFSIFGESYLH